MEPPRSVALIVLDSLRWDYVGALHDGAPATPNLDRLASSGTLFRRAYAPCPTTPGSHDTLLNGILPWQGTTGARTPHARPDAGSLATAATAAGFKTIGLSANPFISRDFGYDSGFDIFVDDHSRRWGSLEHTDGRVRERRRNRGLALWRRVSGDSGATSQVRALRRLARDGVFDHSFFLFMNIMEVHAPYRPPARYLPWIPAFPHWYPVGPILDPIPTMVGARRLSPGAWGALRRMYGASVRWADAVVGQILQIIGARDCALAVTSDHGELLGERGRWGHGHDLSEASIRVPLIVNAPGLPPAIRDDPCSHQDVHRMCRAWMGLGLPPHDHGLLDGCDTARPVFAERPGMNESAAPIVRYGDAARRLWGSNLRAVILGDAKLVRDVTRGEDWMGRVSSTDLREFDGVVDGSLQKMRDLLRGAFPDSPSEQVPLELTEDARVLDRLRGLGYVE